MNALIKEIKKYLENPEISKALAQGGELNTATHSNLLRIFSTVSEPLKQALDQVVPDLKAALDQFEKNLLSASIAKAEKIVEKSFKIISDDPDWQELLSTIDESKHAEFTKCIRQAFITKAFDRIATNNTLETSTETRRFVRNIFTVSNPQASLQELKDDLLVQPTICYFLGKIDLSYFGHAAVAIARKHELVLAAEKPPSLQDNKDYKDYEKRLEKFLTTLPIGQNSNAFIIYKETCYYLDRTKETAVMPAIINKLNYDSRALNALKEDYPALKEKNPQQPRQAAKDVSFTELQRIGSLLGWPPTLLEDGNYLSFGASPLEFTGRRKYHDFKRECESFGECCLITLPPCFQKDYLKAAQAFADKSSEKYSVLFENCAQTVKDFMETAGYDVKGLVRPKVLANAAFGLVLEHLRKERKTILESACQGVLEQGNIQGLRRLIENDIERLGHRIQIDKINRLAGRPPFKDKEKKFAKIWRLRSLLYEVNQVDALSPEIEKTFFEACQNLSSKTQLNLLQGVALFLPPNLNLDAIIKDRPKIMESTESGQEKIRRLIENDIQRLKLQILEDMKSPLSLKHPEKKIAKIQGLQALLHEYRQDHALTLERKEKFAQACEKFSDKTRTHLQECLDCFPQDIAPEPSKGGMWGKLRSKFTPSPGPEIPGENEDVGVRKRR